MKCTDLGPGLEFYVILLVVGAGKFQNALAWQDAAMDMDEVECIVANLIFRRYIKGYISHKNLVVVISKVDAFPPLKNAALKQG